MDKISGFSNFNDLVNKLKEQEIRISNIEAHLHLSPPKKQIENIKINEINDVNKKSDDLLEYNIGQYWFAKLGIFVLLIGIVFLLIFPFKNLPNYVPSILGIFLSVAFMFVSKNFSNKFKYISGYLNGGGIILLFFSILRLHYFSISPVISSIPTETILLLIGVGISFNISVKSKSPYLMAICLLECYITVLINGNTYFIFLALVVLSALVVYIKTKYKMRMVMLLGIVLTYFSHLIWFINNPILGNPVQLRYSPQINTIFLLVYIIIFSLSFIINSSNTKEEYLDVLNAGVNLLFGYGLFFAITLKNTGISFTLLHAAVSIIFLLFATSLWTKFQSKYLTFLFAMTGYLALSILIVNQFKSPDFFIVLCWQSLLVVSTAIWFKSKFIIIANFFIFLMIFILYVVLNGNLNSVSISYGSVALLSAGVLNWKKKGLNLKTDVMTNSYLVMALFIIPYALYHLLNEGWVSISWIGVSIFYYLLSVILKRKKYRWMALATLLFTIVYTFIFGLSNFNASERIISFLVLGVVLLVISLLYAKIKSNKLTKDV